MLQVELKLEHFTQSKVKKGSVGVIIVNFNDAIRTKKLVEQIIDYSNIRYVIVVNNNSTDNSMDILKSIYHHKFLLLNSDINGGYGFGNNIGIRKANELGCDFVLICNPDVIFPEETLNKMLYTLEKYPKCAVINSKETYLGNFAWKYTNGIQDVLSTSIVFNKLLRNRYYKNSYFENKKVTKVDVIQGSFLLSRMNLMMNYGMYDEDFFLYEEEKVLYKKFFDAGFISMTVLDVSYEHHHLDRKYSKISQFTNSKKHLIDSKLLYLKKYRNFSNTALFFSKIFFKFTILEMFFYGVFKIIKEKIRKLNGVKYK